jgi:hypothetical protein
MTIYASIAIPPPPPHTHTNTHTQTWIARRDAGDAGVRQGVGGGMGGQVGGFTMGLRGGEGEEELVPKSVVTYLIGLFYLNLPG